MNAELRRAGNVDVPVLAMVPLFAALVAWKLGLLLLTSAPPRAGALPAAGPGSAGYLLLIGSPTDTAAARRLVPAALETRMHTVPWARGKQAVGGAPARLAGVLGYPHPPVLLTVDGDGRIVRVQPVRVPGRHEALSQTTP